MTLWRGIVRPTIYDLAGLFHLNTLQLTTEYMELAVATVHNNCIMHIHVQHPYKGPLNAIATTPRAVCMHGDLNRSLWKYRIQLSRVKMESL